MKLKINPREVTPDTEIVSAWHMAEGSLSMDDVIYVRIHIPADADELVQEPGVW